MRSERTIVVVSEPRRPFNAHQQQKRDVLQVFYTVRGHGRTLGHKDRLDRTRDIVALLTMVVFLLVLIALAR